ncbi:MAG: ABC transporter permease, partial [Gammaproteobacteria bacterium]|nr:ABC transporter permease [Gammaproteobacteria bacterium]
AALFSRAPTVSAAQRREHLTLVVFLSVVWGATAALSPRFLSASNLRDILIQAAPLGFVALGQMLVIIARGLDLSVASSMATVAVLTLSFTDSAALIILMGLALGLLLGAVNGYLVAYRRVTPFLATLATMIVLQGIRFAHTKGAPSGSLPETLRYLATGSVGGVPVAIILLLAVAAGAHWLLERSRFGVQLKLFGDNPRAAHLCGYHNRWLLCAVYCLSGMLAALGGLTLVGYVGIVDNWTGRGYELDSIAAAVIGGAALTGGKGSVVGVLLATLLLISLFNMVVIIGLAIEFQLVIKGLLIILAAAAYRRGIR